MWNHKYSVLPPWLTRIPHAVACISCLFCTSEKGLSVCQAAEDAVRSVLNHFCSRLTDSVLSASPHTHMLQSPVMVVLYWARLSMSLFSWEVWSTVALQVPNKKSNDFPQPFGYTQSGPQLAASATRLYYWFKLNFKLGLFLKASFQPVSTQPACVDRAVPSQMNGLNSLLLTFMMFLSVLTSRLLWFFRMAALSTSSNCCHL